MNAAANGFPHLRNAPITEALIDVRVDLPADVTVERLKRFGDLIVEHYPETRTRISGIASFDLKANSVVNEQKMDGFLFWSKDRLQVVQARLDGFSVSRLKPYQDWESLCAEAHRRWEQFVGVAAPIRIKRLAVRYINRIELPQPFAFEEYLETFPRLGPGLPDKLSGLFCRMVLHPLAATATVTLAIDEQQVTEASVPVVLDIDVFENVEMPIESGDHWNRLEALRRLKNEIFFGSITAKCRGLFE